MIYIHVLIGQYQQHDRIELAHELSVPVIGAGPPSSVESNDLWGNDRDDELCAHVIYIIMKITHEFLVRYIHFALNMNTHIHIRNINVRH